MKKTIFVILCVFIFNITVIGQNLISISGLVLDAKKDELPQVNVQVLSNSVATVTNRDGEFFLKIPYESKNDSIKFSFVGYKSKIVSIEELASKDEKNIIELSQVPIEIANADITLEDASSFIEEVFKARVNNYHNDKIFQTAFYREMIMKRESYATLAEAVVKINKSEFNSNQSDRAAIYKGRSLRDRRFTDTLFVKLQGGIVSSLLLDIVKNDEILFTDKPTDEYRFWFGRPTVIDGRKMQVVSFNQRNKDVNEILFRGHIYVDSLTKAIVRAEFNHNVEGRKNSASIFFKKKPSYAKIEATEAKYVVSYRFYDDKWHFDYSNTELKFRCRYKGRIFKNNYTVISEMVVTENDSMAEKIPFSQRVKLSDLAYNSAQGFYDENFWEEYNIIEHERGVDNIINRFIRQLDDK